MATLHTEVDPDHDHILGDPNAAVTLVEYGDYECPHCARAEPVVKAVRAAMGDKLRFVFRNFPLTEVHRHAEHAAESAEAAGAQGKYWEMHDAIFAHQNQGLSDGDLVQLAGNIGADGKQIASALEEGTYTERVQDDFMSGVRSGVNGTPTFFINGTRYDGSWDQESLLEALQG